jgi:DNA-binding transcriptional LysR family regulator
MDRIEAMSTFLAAVEAGSLSAASRKVGMPLATVSRKVSELEAHLRTKLINRTSRRLTLTDAGRSYVAGCKRILEDLEEIERAAAGEYAAPRGDLVITAPIVFGACMYCRSSPTSSRSIPISTSELCSPTAS